MAFLLCVMLAGSAGAADKNHSMNIVQFGGNSGVVVFIAEATDASSLGLPMQAVVCDTGNTIFALGNTATFSAVGEQIQFSVDIQTLGLSNGSDALVALTDALPVTDCNNGGEGFIDTFPLPDNFQFLGAVVPTLNVVGLVVLMLGLGGLAWFVRHRKVARGDT